MKVKSESEVAQSCPTLSDPMDCSPPGSSAHGIFQARVLEWDAIAFFFPSGVQPLVSVMGSHVGLCNGWRGPQETSRSLETPILIPQMIGMRRKGIICG